MSNWFMDFKIHSFSKALSTSWSGGETTELMIFPAQAKFAARDFDFRISSATIEVEKSDFTPLPDYNRLLAVLEGELEISHEGKYSKQLPPFESDAFHGSWKTTSKGKVRDFNVIYSDKFTLDFIYLSIEKNTILSKTGGFVFLFLLKDANFKGHQLKKYDLLELDADEIVLEKGFSCFDIRLKRI